MFTRQDTVKKIQVWLELIHLYNSTKIYKTMSDTVHILPCVGNGRTDSVKSNKTHVVRIDFMTGCLSFATADNF